MSSSLLTGKEPFTICGLETNRNVLDFWSWGSSRLLADGPRGDLAEYIVHMALGVPLDEPMTGWGEYDVLYKSNGTNLRIEVKCSSYLQEWERETLSRPSFTISKTKNSKVGEKDADGVYRFHGDDGSEPRRRSDIYVFALFAHTEKSTANPLNLDQWEFYAIPTKTIDEMFEEADKVGLKSIQQAGAGKLSFSQLRAAVDSIASST